jgi:hypothetical protein
MGLVRMALGTQGRWEMKKPFQPTQLLKRNELTIEEIEDVGNSFKQDLQREVNRKIRRQDSIGALATLESIEIVDRFVFTLRLRAGSEIGRRPARAKPIRLFKK